MGKQYPVRLVGEQHYDGACARSRTGQEVFILHEVGNPHDELALVAKNELGETIGYVPRESFVRGVYHEQGRSVIATITERARENGQWQITLGVEVDDEPGDQVAYKPAPIAVSTMDARLPPGPEFDITRSGRSRAALAFGLAVLFFAISQSLFSVLLIAAAAIWLAVSWNE